MSEQWSLPGYEVEVMLGFGAGGEVWRARELATGETVALKRLRPGAGSAAADALRREAAVLAGLDTPYVVGLRAVVGDVLVLDHAGGGSVAALLSRRGRLAPGEVVTVAAPVAEALAAAHARGLVHGDVSPSNVLLTAEGMPLLTDLGLAGALGAQPERLAGTAEYLDPGVVAGRAPDAASDVWALGALCFHLLAGCPPHEGAGVQDVLAGSASGARAPLGLLAPDVPRALVAVVESALADDPAARPEAAALAAALHRAQPASAVRLDPEQPLTVAPPELRETHAVPRDPSAAPAPPRHRRPPRSVVLALGVVTALLAGGLAWALSGAAAPGPALPVVAAPSTAAGSAATPSPGSWLAVLDRLDARRSRAFAAGDHALLGSVYAPGSAVGRADASAVAALVEADQRARGLRHVVSSVRVAQAGRDRAVLRVVDALSPHEVVDAAGRVLQARPGRPAAALEVVLVRVGGAWRIQQVAAST